MSRAGTIGLLVAIFAPRGRGGGPPHGQTASSRAFAASLRLWQCSTETTLPDRPFDAVIDASAAATCPRRRGCGRVGGPGRLRRLAGRPSQVDTRRLVLRDVTAVGILSGSHGLDDTIELYAPVHGRSAPARRRHRRAGCRGAGCWPASVPSAPARAPRSTSTHACNRRGVAAGARQGRRRHERSARLAVGPEEVVQLVEASDGVACG